MAIPTLSGSYIDETYGRLVQVSGSEFADGFGNTISFGAGTAAGPINSIQINKDGSNFTGSSNLSFINNNIQLTGSILMSGSSYISGVDYIDFDINATAPAQSEGRLFWNADSKTLQLDLEQNFHTDLNQQMLVRVVNKTGADIPIGHVVFISGSQGGRPGIKLASYESDDTSAATVGFTAKAINNNNNGYVITRGILDGLNTSAYAVGDRLFLSSSGDFTNIPPDAPLHEVRLGKVIVSDTTNGSIYVDIMNGYELDELHDVKATNPNYGDLFMYSSSLWVASKTLFGSYTLSGSLTTNDGVSVNSLTASIISASTIIGYVSNSTTSSFITNSQTSSFVTNSQTSSFITNSQTSSFVTNSQTASFAITGSNVFRGNQIISASLILSGSQSVNVPNAVSGIVIQGASGSMGLVINELGGQDGNSIRTHILLGQTTQPNTYSYAIYSSLNLRSYLAGAIQFGSSINLTGLNSSIRLGDIGDPAGDGNTGQYLMSTGANSRPQWSTPSNIPPTATVDQINIPEGSNVYIRPDELDLSKYSTHNLYNFQNFS